MTGSRRILLALLFTGLSATAAFAQASANSGWVNNQEGCWCGYQTSLPRTYKVVGKGGVLADLQAGADMLAEWNRFATMFNVTTDSSNTLGGQNGTNELNVFIQSSDSQRIYGFTMTSSLFGRAVMFPNASFGNFNECKDFSSAGCGSFNETDVVINAGFSNGWTNDWFAYGADSDSNNSNPAIIQTTVLHEVGHTLGLHHVFTLPAFGDSYSVMNYINDDSGKFVTRMDAKTIRAEYVTQKTTLTDMAIYPFTFGNAQYAESYASPSTTSLNANDTFSLDGWLIQNVGSQVAHGVVVSFYFFPAGSRPYPQPTDYLAGTATYGDVVVDAEADQSSTPLQVPTYIPTGSYNLGAIVTVNGAEDLTYVPGKPNNNRFVVGHGLPRTVFSISNPNPPPAGISIQSRTQTDSCASGGPGNANGTFDPGETVTINVVAHSTYPAAATGVTGTLTCSTPGVTVSTPTSSFGTLSPGGSGNASPPFAVVLSQGIACGTRLDFTLTFASSQGPSSENFSLRVGSVSTGASTTVLSQSFESWPPPGWLLHADPNTGGIWEPLNHPTGCVIGASTPYANNTGGSGLCADANSDCQGGAMDTAMVTPSFSLASSSYVSAQVQFKSDFYCFNGLDEAWVDITTNGGTTWTNLLYFDHQSIRGPDTQTIDLTPYLGNSDVRLNFEYQSPGWDWYWQVDDVVVSAAQQGTCTSNVCTAPPCDVTCTASAPSGASVGIAASFSATATPSSGCTGTTSFSWTFGDGQSSTQQNPSHTYASSGSFDWTMTATAGGAACTKSGTVVVTLPCTLTCTASVPASASPGTVVAFAATASADHCTGTPTFSWNFGDGGSSTLQNPSHTYAGPGTYNWTLSVSQGGTTCSKNGSITVVNPPSVTLMKKASPPFKIVVTGSNLQSGIRVFINGNEWTSGVWKNSTKIQLTGAIKTAVPKGVLTQFRFLNPDGGSTTVSWSW